MPACSRRIERMFCKTAGRTALKYVNAEVLKHDMKLCDVQCPNHQPRLKLEVGTNRESACHPSHLLAVATHSRSYHLFIYYQHLHTSQSRRAMHLPWRSNRSSVCPVGRYSCKDVHRVVLKSVDDDHRGSPLPALTPQPLRLYFPSTPKRVRCTKLGGLMLAPAD